MSISLKFGGGSFVVDHVTGGLASALPVFQHGSRVTDVWELNVVTPYDVATGHTSGKRQHQPVTPGSSKSGTLVMQQSVWQMSGLNAGRLIPQLTLQAGNRSVNLLNVKVVVVKPGRTGMEIEFTFQKIETSNAAGGGMFGDSWLNP